MTATATATSGEKKKRALNMKTSLIVKLTERI